MITFNKSIKTIFVIVLLFIIFCLVSFFSLKSTATANFKQIMAFRSYIYTNIYLKTGRSLGLSEGYLKTRLFEIIALEQRSIDGQPGYLYSISGQFESIDFNENMIYLRMKNDKIYGFRFVMQDRLRFRDLLLGSSPKINYIVINPQDLNKTVHPFEKGDFIQIYWEDTRSLATILKESKIKNPNQINQFHKEQIDTSTFWIIDRYLNKEGN